jgi:TatA/E family protein of Tat protein translocase
VVGDILQPTHLLFILVIALIVLGPKRLPEVGRSLGKGLRDFRVAMSGHEETEQLRDSLRDARDHLQETHETLQEPVTMEPVAAHQSAAVPVEAPVGGSEPQPSAVSESAPEQPAAANGEVNQPAEAETPEQQPTEASAPVHEPAEHSS